MRKKLITILLTGAMLISSSNKKYKDNTTDNIKFKNNIETQLQFPSEEDSAGMGYEIYKKIILKGVEKKNELYLYENTSNISLFDDEEAIKDTIINWLKEKKHSYRADPPIFNEHYSQINELSIDQNKVIYLMMTSLENFNFANEIGERIRGDIKDKYSESGGIVNFRGENNLNLEFLESESYKLKDKANNGEYLLPIEGLFLKRIAYFHLHAPSYNKYFFAGPSTTDISTLEKGLVVSDLTNEFIITSIRKGEFNIDYIGAYIKKDKKIKIIDLGNYTYDTTKIK